MSDSNLNPYVNALRRGDNIVVPSETVYGLAASIESPEACARIFSLKGRPQFNPLIVHISSFEMLSAYAQIPHRHQKAFQRLSQTFWPGPLTLVLPKTEKVPYIVTAGLETVAIRMPRHPMFMALIHQLGHPIAAPSANLSGHISPTRLAHVPDYIKNNVLALDGGMSQVGLESTILDFSEDHIALLRPGTISLEDLEARLETKIGIKAHFSRPHAPGQIEAHYAPNTPLIVVDGPQMTANTSKMAFLGFGALPKNLAYACAITLSKTENLVEAAANLFECLHQLDDMNLEAIHVQNIPSEDIGRAIMDRLRRAAHGSKKTANR